MATIDVKDAAGATVAIEKPLAPGAAAAAASRPVTLSTEDVARVGIITETAPATDTASSGLNGRLQRIAQRLTSMIAQLPAALGAGGGLKVDGSGTALPISAASLPIPTGAATDAKLDSIITLLTTQAGYLDGVETKLDTIATDIGTPVAHDAVDTSTGTKISGKAIAGLSGATLVSAANKTDLYAGLDGALIIRTEAGLEDLIDGNSTNTDGTSTSVIAAAGAGVKQYVCQAIFANEHATTTGYVVLKSGTTARTGRLAVPPGGATYNFRVPLKPNAANEAWNFDPDAAVTTLSCTLLGFKSKV